MSEYVQPYQDNMNKSIDHLRNDLAAIRAGRANPAVLDKITVDYYGSPTKINQMAAVSVAEARILVITPWDASTIRNIQRAILASDIGINPTDDGRSLRLVFPQLTEERRRDLVKDVKKMGEDCKVAIRNIRRDGVDKFKAMEKKSEITEDDLKDLQDELQKATDASIKTIDEVVKAKETEILEV
ncbi:MAG: ribosome recycling factor [Oscillospiraceae bacterium]|nr:ribosome recycling factor [Oscillospiraceae bacterium]MBQ4240724.1 ribosome recycling factor [Oscillospiraceae bacterium]MBQ5412048.1 ribosome recycling factor [Oscillospiraceae bacterium]